MFNFSAGGERVGETEYARMQTKELLKQQVRIVSEVVVESGHATQTTKLHKFAKQILRVLASCSLMSLAEGTVQQWDCEWCKLLWNGHRRSLGSRTMAEPNNTCVVCRDVHSTWSACRFHGAWWRRTWTWRKWKRCRTRTCNGAIDITVPNEQPFTGTCLCKCLRRPHVQSGRHAGLDVP